MQPTVPTRVLDTRTGVGARAPVNGGATVSLDLSASVPAGTQAAILNVTATDTQRSGLRDGVAGRPAASPGLEPERGGRNQTIATS